MRITAAAPSLIQVSSPCTSIRGTVTSSSYLVAVVVVHRKQRPTGQSAGRVSGRDRPLVPGGPLSRSNNMLQESSTERLPRETVNLQLE